MTDLKPEELVKLREIAEKATPGEHVALSAPGGVPTECCEYGVVAVTLSRETCRVWSREDAVFYAAFSPEVALSLLADRARMEKALREAERELAFAVERMGRTGGGYERALVSVRQALGASQ